MAIQNGEKIVIEFSERLLGDVSDNAGNFTVTFPEYEYEPGGSLKTTTRQPISVGRHLAEVMSIPKFEDATLNGTIIDISSLTDEESIQLNGAVTTGFANFDILEINRILKYESSQITWNGETPTGTQIEVWAKIGNDDYRQCTNGGVMPGLLNGVDYTNSVLTVQAILYTNDVTITPSFKNLSIKLKTYEDTNTIALIFAPGNQNSIQNAAGSVTVNYSGGTLVGNGGPVDAFEETFNPIGLLDKSNRLVTEHIEVSVEPTATLTRIYYTDAKFDEHIEVSITPHGVLTHVDDI